VIAVSGIYWIRNRITGDIYIGSSKDVDRRRHKHVRALKRGTHCNSHLQCAYDKYGRKAFSFRVLITCHADMLVWYEQQFIDQWKPEYNMCTDASRPSFVGKKHTESFKLMMSELFKGIPVVPCGSKQTPEHIRNRSIALKGRLSPTKGKPRSEETKRKISNSMMGNKSCVGRKLSDEHRRKISESNHRRVYSEETRRKLSIAARRKKSHDKS